MQKSELISDRAVAERAKTDFSPALMLSTRAKSWEAIEKIRQGIKPGMTEEEAVVLAKAVCAELGGTKHWHAPKIRFDANTLKTFSQPSEKGLVLGHDSIFFVDLGPVFDGYEGDVGATFTTGSDSEKARCASDCKVIFDLVHARWKEHGESGQTLYEFASGAARERGWELNQEITGHRVSDFPHAVYFKGSMGKTVFRPSAYLWVLEIQLRHPTESWGAFYEDILVD